MLIGFLSDAHGNPFGFFSCHERLLSEGVKQIYFLGDAVGYWPHSAAVLGGLLSLEMPCIKGNHDAMLLGMLPIPNEKESVYQLKTASLSLSAKTKQVMVDDWPLERKLIVEGKRILLVHGRPANPLVGYLYEQDLLSPEESGSFDVIVMGHTHRAFIRCQDNVLWLNAGSCGLPRDIGDMASCVVYDSCAHTARILRVKMDTGSLLGSCPPGSVAREVIECIGRNVCAHRL